jgi:cleavage and polyadenylation specificity factor subunit 1
MDSDANVQHTICAPGDNLAPIVSASIADPYVVIRRSDGSITVFVGDSMARTVAEATVPADVVFPVCQSAEVFTDVSGVYRTFEATQQGKEDTTVASKPAARSRTQLTGEQLRRLQDAKPAIALDSATTESTINASRGTQWLATLADDGELQVSRLINLLLTPDPLPSRPPAGSSVARRV